MQAIEARVAKRDRQLARMFPLALALAAVGLAGAVVTVGFLRSDVGTLRQEVVRERAARERAEAEVREARAEAQAERAALSDDIDTIAADNLALRSQLERIGIRPRTPPPVRRSRPVTTSTRPSSTTTTTPSSRPPATTTTTCAVPTTPVTSPAPGAC